MRLSEQLQRDSDSGDFGRALEEYPKKIKELENALEMCLDFFEGCQVEGEDDPDVCQTMCAQQARLLLYENA